MKGDPKVFIPKDQLEHGAYYEGEGRGVTIARWDSTINAFVYWRFKFGEEFVAEMPCPEDENRYAAFFAFKKILSKDIPINQP